MKGIGFGGIRFQPKIGFTLRIKKSLLKGIHFGTFCFIRTGFTLRTSFIKASILGALCQTKKVQC